MEIFVLLNVALVAVCPSMCHYFMLIPKPKIALSGPALSKKVTLAGLAIC
jgi:hypothetical protein